MYLQYNLDCEFKKKLHLYYGTQQTGKFMKCVPKSETLFITQKLQLQIGLSVGLYLFI